MMGEIIEEESPRNKTHVFRDRLEAANCLARRVIRGGFFFAVADAYHQWHDLSPRRRS